MSRKPTNPKVQNMTDAGINKRREILLAANRLIREQGYNGTSMQDIADDVGLLKGSLYYHFTNKEEMLYELVMGGIERLLNACQKIVKNDSLDTRSKLREVIKQHILHLTMNDHALMLATNELNKLTPEHREDYTAKRKDYSGLWVSILEAGIREGEFPAVNIELTSLAARGMINWLAEWYKPEGNYKPEFIADYFSSLICDLMLGKVHLEPMN